MVLMGWRWGKQQGAGEITARAGGDAGQGGQGDPEGAAHRSGYGPTHKYTTPWVAH